MDKLSAIDIIYILFLAGSLAFGFEALLLGLSGKLMVMFRRGRGKTLALALAAGLVIVLPAIATSISLAIEPIFFAALVLVYTLIASGIIKFLGARFVKAPALPPLPKLPGDDAEKAARVVAPKRPRAAKEKKSRPRTK